MSAMSRRKGANYERSIVDILRSSGHACARNLDQVRDGGGDIPFGDWLIECKRRRSIAVYPWWDQLLAACKMLGAPVIERKPVLVMRADKRENLVVIRLSDFLELVSRTHDSAGSGSGSSTQGAQP